MRQIESLLNLGCGRNASTEKMRSWCFASMLRKELNMNLADKIYLSLYWITLKCKQNLWLRDLKYYWNYIYRNWCFISKKLRIVDNIIVLECDLWTNVVWSYMCIDKMCGYIFKPATFIIIMSVVARWHFLDTFFCISRKSWRIVFSLLIVVYRSWTT